MRMTMKGVGRGIFAAAAVAVCVIGLDATANRAEAKKPGGGGGGPILCYDLWAPVLCPDGNIYSNDCYAARAGQTGCVPMGGGPLPI